MVAKSTENNKPFTWKLRNKRILFVIVLMWVFACSFGQTPNPIKIDSIILSMPVVGDYRSCDTTNMPTEIKSQRINVVVCRVISYLKDSSICRIDIESNDFFMYKCNEFFFLGEKLVKANVLLINRGGVVWNRQIYYDNDKEIRQDGHGQFVMANSFLLNAYKIRKQTIENKR